MIETPLNSITGHVIIRDVQTKEILVDKYNAINFETFSIALAQGIAYRPVGYINEMVFGNGAAIVSGVGTVSYLPPNTQGLDAQLYNETYNKVVNDQSPLNANTTENFIQVIHTPGNLYTDLQITCTLDLNEPAGQEAFDTATDITSPYIFNEIGLKTKASAVDTGLLISHIVFSPLQKSLNRQIEIVYTIRIQTA
jgi:hypothetical protein